MVELSKSEALAVVDRIIEETTMLAKLIGEEDNWMVMVHNKSFLKQFLYTGWESVEQYARPKVEDGKTVLRQMPLF